MPVFGKCPDCGPNSGEVVLTGLWCHAHAAVHLKGAAPVKVERTDVKAAAAEKDGAKKAQDNWYKQQLRQCPKCCENCGEEIFIPKGISQRTRVAHILPKSLFPSVAMHPLNRIFTCHQCHHDFDHATPGEQGKMKVAALCKERVALMWPEIATSERSRVPAWMVPEHAKASPPVRRGCCGEIE